MPSNDPTSVLPPLAAAAQLTKASRSPSQAAPVNIELERLLELRLSSRIELQIEQTRSSRMAGTQDLTRARWTVFDPLTRQSFRIGWIEHWILTRVDGKQSVRQLLLRFRAEQPQVSISDGQLMALFEQFHRNELVRNQQFRPANSQAPIQSWLSSLVVWQVRGIQPDRWLAWLAPHTNALFSGAAVKLWLVLAVLTTCAVLLEFQRLALQSSSWQWLLRPSSGGMLFGVFLATRVFHELGHALVCKRFGVRCPDIGLFLILGAPCVYCDVSESWRLPNRWHRAAVATAGMYVELVVATLAAWCWLATVDGVANTLALQTMIVCSVSTILINANPLMRFDGYYILADWLDEANLRSKADSQASCAMRRVLLGSNELPSGRIPSALRRRSLIAFSLAGWVYRATLSVTIASLLVAIYSNWNLVWLGRILAAAILVSWWGVPAVKLVQSVVKNARSPMQRLRLAMLATMALLVLAVIPFPNRRFASGWIQPQETQGVFASATARLVQCSAQDGDFVSTGQPLFGLSNTSFLLQAIERDGDARKAIVRRETQRRQRDMHGQDIDLSVYESDVHSAGVLAENARRDLQRLRIHSPISGRFCAAEARTVTGPVAEVMSGQATWCSVDQVGRVVPQGTLLGTVISPNSIAVIPLDESQLADVAAGTEVRIHLPHPASCVSKARVASIVQFDEVSKLWQQGQPGSSTFTSSPSASTTDQGSARFAAIVNLPDEVRCLPGSSIEAVFVAQSNTITSLARRLLQANLRLLAD